MPKHLDTISRHPKQPVSADALETPIPSMQTETPTPDTRNESFDKLFPEPSVIMSGPPGWVWWILLMVGAAGLGFLAFTASRNKIDSWLSVSTPSPTITATATATPTPSPTSTPTATPSPSASPSASSIAKSAITMRVLNGTTKSGAAATMRTTLEKAGFTVRTIGNAKTQNYTTTTIYYSDGHLAEATLVANALAPTKTTLQQSTLASPDMILVVVGTN